MQYRTCKNGDECLHPDGPRLPLSEFYEHYDGYHNMCKACFKEYIKQYQNKPRQKAGNSIEGLVIWKLRSTGVYAAPGKCSEYRWVDVVARGCVRIEVKGSSRHRNGHYQWFIGPKKAREDERSDFVVLVMLDDAPSFFVFPSEHPAFYHQGGIPKRGVRYTPSANVYKASGVSLNDDLMEAHRDRFDLIDAKSQEIERALMDQITPFAIGRKAERLMQARQEVQP
jgi:hypothetical protein